jgi:fluoride exporter
MTVLLVAVAGALGAAARYLTDRAVTSRTPGVFPAGTLLVNVLGSVTLGALAGANAAGEIGGPLLTWAGTGFLGAFTTFSTFTFETLQLVEDGAWRPAAMNVLLSGPLCFAGAGLAFLATR